MSGFRPAHYWRIAKKYFRMNPHRLWWVSHVKGEIMSDLKKQEVYSKRTEITLSSVPLDRLEDPTGQIKIVWRGVDDNGEDLYGVYDHVGRCLDFWGEFVCEPPVPDRDAEWVEDHRFGYREALRRGREAVLNLT